VIHCMVVLLAFAAGLAAGGKLRSAQATSGDRYR
jgi:hypothetical protein